MDTTASRAVPLDPVLAGVAVTTAVTVAAAVADPFGLVVADRVVAAAPVLAALVWVLALVLATRNQGERRHWSGWVVTIGVIGLVAAGFTTGLGLWSVPHEVARTPGPDGRTAVVTERGTGLLTGVYEVRLRTSGPVPLLDRERVVCTVGYGVQNGVTRPEVRFESADQLRIAYRREDPEPIVVVAGTSGDC
jgi:hypothetical protein